MVSPNNYTEEQIAVLSLSMISGIGAILVKQMVAYSGSANEALHGGRKQLGKIPGLGQQLIQNIENERSEAVKRAKTELLNLEKCGGAMHSYLDKSFPSRLKAIPDGPAFIFTKGHFNFENPRILAVVGTRQATLYGKDAITQFLEELRPFNPVVVSGLAYGIDIAAHKTSVDMGLENWGIMATGMDKIYPSVHKSVAESMQKNGGLITENLLGTKPDAPRFPARNRIIAGLCDAVWVVEAMEKGGALITARLGAEYFKDVFALPGNISSKASVGCNQLIYKNVAAIATSGGQLAEAMGWQLADGLTSKNKKGVGRPPQLGPEATQILDLFDLVGELPIDEIAWRTQLPINQLASHLLTLEFQGLVKSLPGKRFSAA